MRGAKLKAYEIHNIDGRNAGLVAAFNQVDAAKKLGMSHYSMRQMGWHFAKEADAALCMKSPDVALYRPIDNSRGYPWAPHKWTRDYTAGVGHFRPWP